MVRLGALLAVVLLLAAAPFAETYSKKYVSGGWLEVTRVIESGVEEACPLPRLGVSDACAHSGAKQDAGSALTRVALTVKNVGAQDRSYVSVGESLSYVPAGAGITFSPSPSQFDGRQAVWEIPSLAQGEARTLSYEFTATVSEAAVGRVPDAVAAAAPSTVALYAPSRLKVGGTLTLSLKSPDGRPVPGAKIVVGYPDGSRQAVRTDGAGTVSLVASREGSYTYVVDGYSLSQLVSSVAEEEKGGEGERLPPAAASAADAGLLSGVAGALPVLAAIFAVAVIALITYNFLAARREEEESSGPAPQLAEQQAQSQPGVTYTQKFSFGPGAASERKIDDATRGMVESRKRRMHEPPEGRGPGEGRAGRMPQEGEGARGIPEETVVDASEIAMGSDAERTVASEGMDDELAELERSARIAGEVAEQEKEVENMLAQLEEIRNRLRAGREGAGEDAGAGRPEAKKPKPPAPSPAKAAGAPARQPAPKARAAQQKKPAPPARQKGK